jgi:serine/threonine protein kinase
MSQALALLQNKISPNREDCDILFYCDIKPNNILVVDIGTTYPSFKLHDFDIAKVYRKTELANQLSAASSNGSHQRI